MTIAVRRAAARDAGAVADLFLASFHATYAFPLAHADDEVRAWIRDRLIPTEEVWLAIDGAGSDEQLVGMLALAPGWLEQLYVAPDRLGEGIGSRLMAVAKARQPDRLQLWTFQVNARARRFYESHGFTAVEETVDSNQEKQPDVRYVWSGASAGSADRYPAEP